MPKTVQIPAGKTNVQIPSAGGALGYPYDGPKTLTLTDDQVAALSATAFSSGSLIDLSAKVTPLKSGVIGTGAVYVYRESLALASVANGNLAGVTVTPGFAGTIKHVRAVVTTAATTAAKTTDLSVKIGATAITGGVATVTSANATPVGAVVNGTAVTALNVFTATDVLQVFAANTTAFVEGNIVFEVLLVAS